MELIDVVKFRITELKEMRDYLTRNIEEDPRIGAKVKRSLHNVEELLKLNISILEGISHDSQVWH